MHLSKGIGRQGRSGSTSGTPQVGILKQEVSRSPVHAVSEAHAPMLFFLFDLTPVQCCCIEANLRKGSAVYLVMVVLSVWWAVIEKVRVSWFIPAGKRSL